MLKMSLERLDELWARLGEGQSLYLPIEKDNIVNYRRYTVGDNVRLDALNSEKSPKELFFPQTENMVAFAVNGKTIQIVEQELSKEKFVLFGVRACDERAFDVLDRVFLAEPRDSFYAARRENGTIVTLACAHPDETCFCGVFGVDLSEPGGDVTTWIVGDTLYWRPNTDKGEKLTETVRALFTDADAADEKAVQTAREEAKAALDEQPLSHLSLEGFEGENMNELFNSPKWDALSEACLGCGTCTFHCPTCQCYDIRDYDTGHGVQRYRCWDSCMYSDFTMMAAETPRPTQKARFRQRFMHKLVYYPMNNEGLYSCVGCGRCVRLCPIHMNIAKVIKALGGHNDDK